MEAITPNWSQVFKPSLSTPSKTPQGTKLLVSMNIIQLLFLSIILISIILYIILLASLPYSGKTSSWPEFEIASTRQ